MPGDKSVSHRALILGALASGETLISGCSLGDDTRRTAAALRMLGVVIEERGANVRVTGCSLGGLRAPTETLDCGNSGTSLRLLCGLLAGQPFSSRLDGDRSLRTRPMKRIVEPLRQMGAQLGGATGSRADELHPPLEVQGPPAGECLRGIDYRSRVASAQVKSAVLLAGLFARGWTRVREPVLSRDHTERMMRYLGLPLQVTGASDPAASMPGATIDGDAVRPFAARPLTVPGDLSSAAFPLCAGLLVPRSRVAVGRVSVNPTRTGLLDVLRAMGCRIERREEREESGEPTAELEVAGTALQGTAIGGELAVRAIDELPVLAVLAACAHGTTEIRDALELRVKESDRITVMAEELRRLGAEVEELPDGLRLAGGASLRGARCHSHGDHRIAMSLCVAGLVAEGETVVEDTDNIATSFPGFVETMRTLGADLTEE